MKTHSDGSPRTKRGEDEAEDPNSVTPKYKRRLRPRKSLRKKDSRKLRSKTTKDNVPSTSMAANIDLQFNFDISSPVREKKSSKLMTRTPIFNLVSGSPIEASMSPVHAFRSPYSSRFALLSQHAAYLCRHI